MKTRTKIAVGILATLLPALVGSIAVQLEGPREIVQLGAAEAQAAQASVVFLNPDVIRRNRTFEEAVKYELGLTRPDDTEPLRRHRHHHRGQNVSVAPGKVHKVSPCTRRDGITICDPKALTRTKIDRRPRRSHSWYLPERETQTLEPFGTE